MHKNKRTFWDLKDQKKIDVREKVAFLFKLNHQYPSKSKVTYCGDIYNINQRILRINRPGLKKQVK
jgi:hypothetical protein